jgi:hypothetical protein
LRDGRLNITLRAVRWRSPIVCPISNACMTFRRASYPMRSSEPGSTQRMPGANCYGAQRSHWGWQRCRISPTMIPNQMPLAWKNGTISIYEVR